MAVIFMSQEETGDVEMFISSGSVTANTSITAGTWSTYAFGYYASGTSGTAGAPWASAVGEFYGQARVHFRSGAPNGNTGLNLFQSPNGVVQCSIGWSGGSQIRAFRSNNAVTLGTGTTIFAEDRWYFIQWHVVISDTVGVFTVKVDGVTEIDVSNVDTKSDGASALVDRFAMAADGGHLMDDYIIFDTTGSTNITYPDNLGIEALIPNAAGDVTGLTPLGGANYTNVDERPPDGATSYVSSGTVDLYDLYNIPATQWNSVSCVALDLDGTKTDAGAKSIAHMIKADTDANSVADTEYQGADVPLATTYAHTVKYYDQQPDSTNWTVNKVNALQIGAKVRP